MEGGDFINEVDCNSFFDQMDDLVEFPADINSGIFSGGSSDLTGIWSNPLPHEDIVQLEWLSNFVEDSFSDGGLTMPKENNFPNKDLSSEEFQPSSPVSSGSFSSSEKTFPPSPTQRGVRTKRPRPTTFNASSFLVPKPVQNYTKYDVALHERKKVKPAGNRNASIGESENVRKCMHCEITKTPQWRLGPNGPKTLCNACGVRYKSGRLFPEYRPAASPTFVASVHSNSHRKVLEMRNRSDEKSPIEVPAQLEIIPNTTAPSLDCV